jgi:hypothetical protein
MAADMGVDINHSLDPELKKAIKGLVQKLKKFKITPGHVAGGLAGVAGLSGAASLGSAIGRGLGEKVTRSGHAKHAFWTGFVKAAR